MCAADRLWRELHSLRGSLIGSTDVNLTATPYTTSSRDKLCNGTSRSTSCSYDCAWCYYEPEPMVREIAAAVAPPLSLRDFQQQMASARFCLVVRGDSPMTSKLPEAVLSGCIPVIAIEGPLPLESVRRSITPRITP